MNRIRAVIFLPLLLLLAACSPAQIAYYFHENVKDVTPEQKAAGHIFERYLQEQKDLRFRAYITAVAKAKFESYIIAVSRPAMPCGGDLPPCYVLDRESGHGDGNPWTYDIHAENPISTASGKWQFLDSTWNGYGGVSHAAYADEATQNAKAREVWAGGAGCSHWNAC